MGGTFTATSRRALLSWYARFSRRKLEVVSWGGAGGGSRLSYRDDQKVESSLAVLSFASE